MYRSLLIALLFLGALAYGFRPGVPGFRGDGRESRTASIARGMVETGEVLIPRLNGEAALEEPPLSSWIVAASMRLTGNREELGARLPSALAALAVLVLVYRLGLLLGGTGVGLWSVVLLLGNLLFFRGARTAGADLLLTAASLGTVTAFLEAKAETERRFLPLLGWAGLAVGFLLRGTAGVLVPLVLLGAFLGAAGDRRHAGRWMRPLAGIPLFLALVLPWFVLVLRGHPEAVPLLGRAALGTVGGLGPRGPFWLDLPVLVAGFLPGSAFFYWWIRAVRGGAEPIEIHLRWLGAGILGLFLAVSLAVPGRIDGLLPLWPFLAVGTALALEWAASRECGRALGRVTALVALLPALAAVVAVLVPLAGGPRVYESGPMATSFLLSIAVIGFRSAWTAWNGSWESGLLGLTVSLVLVGLCLVQVGGPLRSAYRVHERAAIGTPRPVPDIVIPDIGTAPLPLL